MKKVTLTFSVYVEDEFCQRIGGEHKVTTALYEHICEWEGNENGTVEAIDEKMENEEIFRQTVSLGDNIT